MTEKEVIELLDMRQRLYPNCNPASVKSWFEELKYDSFKAARVALAAYYAEPETPYSKTVKHKFAPTAKEIKAYIRVPYANG